MTRTELAAAFMQGYWSALLTHGHGVPSTLRPHLNLAQAILNRQVDEADVPTLVAEMVAEVERLEYAAHAMATAAERN